MLLKRANYGIYRAVYRVVSVPAIVTSVAIKQKDLPTTGKCKHQCTSTHPRNFRCHSIKSTIYSFRHVKPPSATRHNGRQELTSKSQLVSNFYMRAKIKTNVLFSILNDYNSTCYPQKPVDLFINYCSHLILNGDLIRPY